MSSVCALSHDVFVSGLYGLPLIVFVITLQIYTGVILGRCWVIAERIKPQIVAQNRYPYAAIADMTYGRTVSLLVTILLDLSVFGGGVPNLLVGKVNHSFQGRRPKLNLGFLLFYSFPEPAAAWIAHQPRLV